jgi:copper/silver efflux system protein
MINRLIHFCLTSKLLVLIGAAAIVVLGFKAMQDNPKDAIPDISENQVIVSTEWMGRSPQDMEDQITYPLAVQMQGIPRVVDVRTMSGFGMSRIYVVFEDGVDVYWSRSRVLERLAVAQAALPEGVRPELGPDATPIGWIYFYTVDGPYDLATLRSLQDYTVRYALQGVPGVAEVASIGGFVREYQIDVNPDALRAHGLTIEQIVMAVRMSNMDVGAKTIEQGGLEHVIRGIGFIRSLEHLEQIVLKTRGHVPVLLRDVATVQFGPEFRRGALADQHGERTGGLVAARYGADPQTVIAGINEAIERLQPALPEGVTINPFYDRTELIDETLETLTDTILLEILITVVVVLLFMLHLRSGLIVSATIPLSVLLAFIGMQALGMPSNIMSLGGIIIAIGTVVDMGIIMTERIYRGLQEDGGKSERLKVVYESSSEVGGAILTAVLTTVVSFLPIFFLPGQSYKLFAPLAWTRTFTLLAAAIVGLTLIPVLCHLFLGGRAGRAGRPRQWAGGALRWTAALGMAALIAWLTLRWGTWLEARVGLRAWFMAAVAFILTALAVLRIADEKLTPIETNPVARTIVRTYVPVLRYFLRHKGVLVGLYAFFLFMGALAAFGARTVLAPVYAAVPEPERVRPLNALSEHFPGFGREFMPPLDEGSLLYMPSLLAHAGLTETLEAMEWQNRQMASVPEVALVMGKLGRAETALDPAPIGMIETVVLLKPRSQWRPGMDRQKLIGELRQVTHQPGVAPSWLQPIETRVVMLSSGIRARIGLEIVGDDATRLAELALALEPIVREVDGASDVVAMRTGGKPYVHIIPNEERMVHYGVNRGEVNELIEIALGGKRITTTVEARERYPVRVRYQRELRDSLETIGDVLVSARNGAQVPLSDVADFEYVTGPSEIRGINGQLVGYVMFNPVGIDETRLIDRVDERVRAAIASGEVAWPTGYSFRWVGQYKEAQKANRSLMFIIPLAIGIILLLVFLHFRRFSTALIVFAGIPLGAAGGAILIRYWPELQSLGTGDPVAAPVYLTVAVVVGFIALLGILVDDGVVIGTYIQQLHERENPATRQAVREVVIEAGSRRIRPTLMTTATTLMALMPVLLTTGRGSDVLQPMALPVVGGMLIALLTLFVVPVAMSAWLERSRPDA